ncbi:hypothetical protein V2J09_015813 [Rumex salicifolius]
MEQLRGLPFKVGDRVELKSFKTGYRGAWFRCEIKETGKKGVALDLYDYTDDGITWMKSLHHKVPCKSSTGRKVELMLRPQFPPLYNEGEVPDLNSLSEVIVVTNGAWKVGDLVDWFCEEAYWSGTIIKFLGDDKVQIKSPTKPMGEDMVYEALCKELRPSLNWTRKSGWTVPVPRRKDNHCPCARLIKPVNPEKDTEAAAAKESPSQQNACAYRSSENSLSFSQREKGTELEATILQRAQVRMKDVDVKGSCSDSVSSTFCKEQQPLKYKDATERLKLIKSVIPLNSSTCDSIESLIMDMEELQNRVKWIKRILESLPDSANSGWKFQEYRAGGTQLVLALIELQVGVNRPKKDNTQDKVDTDQEINVTPVNTKVQDDVRIDGLSILVNVILVLWSLLHLYKSPHYVQMPRTTKRDEGCHEFEEVAAS